MTSLSFIHTADLHLDSPFKGLSNIPRELHDQIYQSTFKAFHHIIDYCIEYQVDFLLIAGDVYDLEDRSIKAQIYFLRELERLSASGIAVYIIHGNHDPADKITTKFHWPANVSFLSSKQVESIPYFKNGVEVARIYGRSYPTKEFKENIVIDYKAVNEQVYHIGLLHSNINGDPLHDTYCPTSLKELVDSQMDYWALGHIHKGEILQNSGPVIAYPGNPQGRHMKEQGEKGCLLVQVDNSGRSNITFLPTAEIIFDELNVNVSQVETIESLINQIQLEIEYKQEVFNKPLILRLYLTGKTNLHQTLVKGGTLEELREILNKDRTNGNNWIWVEQLFLQTKPNIPLEELTAQNHVLADFIQQLQSYVADEEQEQIAEVSKELLNNRRIKKHLSSLSDEDIQEIYQQILNLALDYFLEEEIS